ncbi:RidA family protein [Pseudomonas kulmbachensis]|uniref:RidA family protein n=1 Tax=Pseudomonas kulmbachensis TaxID=3043408 RepID=UPI002AAFB507|nr:RidA family protein [Pseudomonas sp. FLM 004-28]
MSKKIIPAFLLTSLLAGLMASQVNAAEVIRHKLPNSDFPISLAVEIPPGVTLVNLSGVVPPVADSKADPKTLSAYGNTEVQTVNVLKNIEATLKNLGLTMGDVIKMQVYLVGTPETGKMDFTGFMKGYTQFFGTKDQPKLPTRSAFQVAGLANPNYLVEIEVTAARP